MDWIQSIGIIIVLVKVVMLFFTGYGIAYLIGGGRRKR